MLAFSIHVAPALVPRDDKRKSSLPQPTLPRPIGSHELAPEQHSLTASVTLGEKSCAEHLSSFYCSTASLLQSLLREDEASLSENWQEIQQDCRRWLDDFRRAPGEDRFRFAAVREIAQLVCDCGPTPSSDEAAKIVRGARNELHSVLGFVRHNSAGSKVPCLWLQWDRNDSSVDKTTSRRTRQPWADSIPASYAC